ncbi:hypothetical protein [Mesorhizobium sp. Cs1299R1N3]|uniref:hypothetical protein n=1 Tax=Mesorhizobium sp. Cs1299R1N3 TaxID=3015173 RepID=UPI00301DB17A
MLDRDRKPVPPRVTGRSHPAERISELIGSIYDCVLDPERWPSVVDDIRRELEFCFAVLGVYPLPGGEVMLCVATGLEQHRVHDPIALSARF